MLASIRKRSAQIFDAAGNDHEQIERHIEFQTMVAELAADLVNLPLENLDENLVRALERIARFGGEQRGYLFVVDRDGRWHVAQEWHEEGLALLAETLTDDAPVWTLAQLSAGRTVWIRTLADLAPEASAERGLCRRFGIRSAVVVPIRSADSELSAAALFVSHDREADWPDDFHPLCDLAGGLLGGALARRREHVGLGHSEARLRCLLDSAMLGILTARRDGLVLDANDAALMVTGYDRRALEAGEMRWDDMTPIEYRHLTASAIDQLERVGHCPPWEQDFYRRDGSRVAALLGLAGLQDDPGTFLVFALDVTARKRAEHELTEHKRLARLMTVLSTRFIGIASDRIDDEIGEGLREIAGVVGLDRCSVWQFLHEDNSEAELTHRWDCRSAAGMVPAAPHVSIPTLALWNAAFAKHDFVLVRNGGNDLPEDSAERLYLNQRGVHSALAVPLLQGEDLTGFVTFVSRRSDEEWSQSRVALLRIAGEIIGAALQRRHTDKRRMDVQRELEERFAARTSQLESVNRELEAFSHAVSHDLRAPLRGIDGFSRILVDDHSARLPADAGKLLERIRTTCQRMDGLIDALLALSRISRSQPEREHVDLSALAATLCESLREGDPARRITFVVEPSLSAVGEPRLVRALLDNLLRNSWKFTAGHDTAQIEFGSFHEGRVRVFYVRDDGVGFDPSQAQRLFQPFQRLHAPGLFEGFGVGLATVQRIVAIHGGKVWAESGPDQGATVYFTLESGD